MLNFTQHSCTENVKLNLHMLEWSYDSTHSPRRHSIRVSEPHSHGRFTFRDRGTQSRKLGGSQSWSGPWKNEKYLATCRGIESRFLWRAGRSPVTRVSHTVPTLHFMWRRSITSKPNVGNGGRDFTYTIWDINHSVFQVFPFRTIYNDNITVDTCTNKTICTEAILTYH